MFLKLLPFQGDLVICYIPRVLPWARSFCPFRACGCIRLFFYCIIDESDDFILLVGMIPVDFSISLKPGELLAHVFTAMRLYLADGFILIYLAIEIGKQLLVAHGSQGGETLVRIYAAGFRLQTILHHQQHTLVDAVVQFGTVAVQTYLDDTERTLLLFGYTERSVGLAGLVTDFQGMHHAAWILLIYYRPMLRVHLVEFFYQRFQAFLFQALFHPGADVIPHGRNIVDTLAYGIDIHHAAACKQRHIVILEDFFFQKIHHIGLVLGCAVIIFDVVVAYEIMLDPLLLFGSRRCGSDREFGEDLAGVGIDNRDREMLCQRKTELGLTNTCRT